MPEIKQPFSFKRSQPKIDAAAMLNWYDQHARALPWRIGPHDRAKGIAPNPYFVWLSEIMLQQTTVPTVGKYFAAFTSRWPTVFDLAAAERDDVLKEWAGLGYYARARNLHACATKVVEVHGGVFPQSADELQELPGIGPYTSAAIAAICFDEQVAVIDGNVDRVVARYTALPHAVRDVKPAIREFVQDAVPKRAGDFAQSLMDLGATICAPKRANCLICPVQSGCAGTKTAEPAIFPIKPAKKQKPRRTGHAFVVENSKGEVWLQQRPEKGLLAAMTEVPGTEWQKLGDDQKPNAKSGTSAGKNSSLSSGSGAETDVDINEMTDRSVSFPSSDESWERCGEIEHVFTHFALTLTVWKLQSELPPTENGWWCHKSKLNGEALPTVFKKVLAAALEKSSKFSI